MLRSALSAAIRALRDPDWLSFTPHRACWYFRVNSTSVHCLGVEFTDVEGIDIGLLAVRRFRLRGGEVLRGTRRVREAVIEDLRGRASGEGRSWGFR